MTATQTQISNLFNRLVQADPRILSYHFGQRVDIMTNVYNNFDDGTTGRMFPAVQWEVPERIEDKEEPSYDSTPEVITMQLYFDDNQDRDNFGNAITDNLIEQWSSLKIIADDFMANFVAVLDKYGIGNIEGTVSKVEREMQGTGNITWEYSFSLKVASPCTDEQFQVDLSNWPPNIPTTDLENTLAQSFDNKYSFFYNNTNQEYRFLPINPAYDFTKNTVFSISAWIYIDAPKSSHIIGKYEQASECGWFLAVTSTGQTRFDLQANGGTNGMSIRSDVGVLSSGQWHLIQATANGTGNALGSNLYLDGQPIALNIEFDSLTGSIINTETVKIGALPAFNQYFSGYTNHIMVHMRELTAADCLAMWNDGKPTKPLNPANDLIWDKGGEGGLYNDDWITPNFADVNDPNGIRSVNMNINSREEFTP
jgi:hypothetical protein